MNLRSFGLEFDGPRAEPLPHPALARIVLNRYRHHEGRLVLGADCASSREFQEQIEWLKTDLDRILGEAQRKFALKHTDLRKE